jgi:hypothetical protein
VPDGRFDVVVDAHRGQPAVRAALSEYEQAAFPRAAEAAGAEDIFDLMLGDNTPTAGSPPAPDPFSRLVKVADARWAAEDCFQAAKNEVGMDHYQVRRYEPWYRYVILAMLALAFLAATRAALADGSSCLSCPAQRARSAACSPPSAPGP